MNNRALTYTILSAILFIAFAVLWIFLLVSAIHIEQSALILESKANEERFEEAALFTDAATVRTTAVSSKTLFGIFVSSNNVASLVEAIEKNGSSNGITVSVDSISAGTVTTAPLSTLSISISASGSWKNLLAFAATLEKSPYDIVFNKISFFKSPDSGKIGWHIQADISSFISN